MRTNSRVSAIETRYQVSRQEIIRREKAFLSLSISLFLGMVAGTRLVDYPLPIYFWVGLAGVLLILNLWLKRFFNSFLKMETSLSKEFLLRKKEKYLIKKINKIQVKWTTRNTVREVGLFFDDGKNIFINGLSDFEKFTTSLLKMINKKAVVKNIREPMDFDSVFFYPVLGLILSLGTVYLLKLMTTFSEQTMRAAFYVSIVYVLAVGLYLIISTPISKRY